MNSVQKIDIAGKSSQCFWSPIAICFRITSVILLFNWIWSAMIGGTVGEAVVAAAAVAAAAADVASVDHML